MTRVFITWRWVSVRCPRALLRNSKHTINLQLLFAFMHQSRGIHYGTWHLSHALAFLRKRDKCREKPVGDAVCEG